MFRDFIENNSERARTSLSVIIKIIVILSVVYGIYFHLWRILFVNLLLLILTFIPLMMKKQCKVNMPKEFEILLLIFVLVSFFLGEYRGLVIQIFFGLAIGFIGFALMLIVYLNSKIKPNYFLIFLFSFSFSIALGLSLEILKFYTKIYFGEGVNVDDYMFTMMSLSLVALGGLVASASGYIYMKGHRTELMSRIVSRFKRKNPNLFIQRTDSPEEVLKMIKEGEKEKLEFKSTLRTNLFTCEFDREIERAILKTIAAFLNSEGGTLLIGVTDNREIIGIERDNFQSNDKFALHFTNLLKEKLGNQFLPYINSEFILIEGKNILKVECAKSDMPVFLKNNKIEEFYIRAGPATIQLTGSKLVDYIRNNFG